MSEEDWKAYWANIVVPADGRIDVTEINLTSKQRDALFAVSVGNHQAVSYSMRNRLRDLGLIEYPGLPPHMDVLTPVGSQVLLEELVEALPSIAEPLPVGTVLHMAVIDAEAGTVETAPLPVTLIGVASMQYDQETLDAMGVYLHEMDLEDRPVSSINFYYRLGPSNEGIWAKGISDANGHRFVGVVTGQGPMPRYIQYLMQGHHTGRTIKLFETEAEALDFLSDAGQKLAKAFAEVGRAPAIAARRP
ncbi:hypothetical protein ACFOY8_11870 [Thalassospira xianhensis]|uniref:Uncharacterized protein n=1 Tax=Thalassospira xianhensis MCCC 1A02616 TaxID=1177929 RepID=A0A367U8U9_9PROT|nr:hypothetical protein [Thalassospira xianhensis]RCK04133.1 hypothetical protein TH5_21355 [Thalassospira xianhensis MCCC 1A02616]